MRKIYQSQAVLALMAALATSCSSVAPGSDPVVVRAQQAIQSSFQAVDLFLKTEYDNRAELAKLSPDIHVAAEFLRGHFPGYYDSARKLLEAYKANRSDANNAALQEAVGVLQAALDEAGKYLAVSGHSP